MSLAYVGLVRLDLPSGPVTWSDGGSFLFDGLRYEAAHSAFGAIDSFSNITEGAQDEIPTLEFTVLPTSADAGVLLSASSNQGSRLRVWLAEYNIDTSQIATSEILFSGFMDFAALSGGPGSLRVDVECVAEAERLFSVNEGNDLSHTQHQAMFPNENGHAAATGLGRPVAWGVDAPPRARTGVGGGGGGGGGFGSNIFSQTRLL